MIIAENFEDEEEEEEEIDDYEIDYHIDEAGDAVGGETLSTFPSYDKIDDVDAQMRRFKKDYRDAWAGCALAQLIPRTWQRLRCLGS